SRAARSVPTGSVSSPCCWPRPTSTYGAPRPGPPSWSSRSSWPAWPAGPRGPAPPAPRPAARPPPAADRASRGPRRPARACRLRTSDGRSGRGPGPAGSVLGGLEAGDLAEEAGLAPGGLVLVDHALGRSLVQLLDGQARGLGHVLGALLGRRDR